jgi:hypothetical protein
MLPKVLTDFKKDNTNTFLVSYYRTGTHWLLMCLEAYFDAYVLLENTYFHGKQSDDIKEILLVHSHDAGRSLVRDVVVYLYRNPVDVVFSRIYSFKQSLVLSGKDLILKTAKNYKLHLEKWLLKETFTTKKTLISYDLLIENFETEFSKAIEHFYPFVDLGKVSRIKDLITKEAVKKRTKNLPRIMPQGSDYNEIKLEFVNKYSKSINELIFEDNKLNTYFKGVGYGTV